MRERAEAEARGESFWTTGFNEKVRTKLMYAAQTAAKYQACPDEAMPNVIEALYLAMETFGGLGGPGYQINLMESNDFAREVQQILEEERVAFGQTLAQSQIPSRRDALEEVTKGKPGDAITDAGTALQETLKALGCKGNSLGPLIKLLAPHDDPLTEPILHWVAADRSEKGDSHKAEAATKQDAWLTIHVVGALIVRLVGGSRN